MPPRCESILGLKVEVVQGNRFPWNGLRYLGESWNGGTTLQFLSPFLLRAPPLEMRWEATDPLIYAKGRVTLLLQLERKAHVQGPTRDED